MKREPTLTELGIFSVMWSEHCSYKSSRVHLKKLPTTGPRVLQGPGENAGAVDIGDGLAAVFKIESHNHPVVHRAVPGRGDRRRRHHPRHLHHGRAADRAHELAAVRIARRSGRRPQPPHRRRRRRRHRRLRQQHRHCHGRRRDRLRRLVLGQPARQRLLSRNCQGRRARPSQRLGRRQPRLLRRRQDRPRRHPRRDDGVGRVRREVVREAARGAGRRSVHGEAPPRSLPRADADRRAHRRAGHGRGRVDLFDLRDGRARRQRHRDRRQPRAAARDRHDAVRNHALRIAGTHAPRRQEGARGRSRSDLREVGSARVAHRRRDERRDPARQEPRRGRGRDPERPARRRGARLQPPRRPPGLSRCREPAGPGHAGTAGRGRERHRGAGCPVRDSRFADGREQTLGVSPVRPHGAHQLDRPGRDGRRCRPHQGHHARARDVDRRQRPLLLPESRGAAPCSRSPRRRATWRAPARCRSAAPTA